MRRPHLRLAAGAATTTVVATALMVGTGAPTMAAPTESTYLVLAPEGVSTAQAVARVNVARGRVLANYSQIGVLVVRSSNAKFTSAVAGSGVESVAGTAGLGTAVQEDVITEVQVADASGDPTGEPFWSRQWDMQQIDVPAAQAVTTGSPDVLVGVLDSGIDATHPDLATQVDKPNSASCVGGIPNTSQAAWSPTTSGHGTHVAGTIAAAINGIGIAGVAPGVKVASVKVVDDNGFIYPEAAVCGFMWAATHGMDITNNSYFIDPWEFNCRNDARQRPIWLAVQRAIRYSGAQGVLNIASAGNSNYDLQKKFIDPNSPNDGSGPVEERIITGACLDLPAEAPGVVTVSAVGPGELKSYYSNYGLGVVDVAAPGGDTRWRNYQVSTLTDAVFSTVPGGWAYSQGTSMASPHVAGVAALAKSAHPELTAGGIAALLETTADPLTCPEGVYDPRPNLPQYQAVCSGGERTSFYGAGNVNAFSAVQ